MSYTKKQIKKIERELTPLYADDLFDAMLDETSEVITIAGMKYNPSRVLAEVDPVAYRCCVADYIDSLIGETIEEVNGNYYDIGDVTQLLNEEEEEVQS